MEITLSYHFVMLSVLSFISGIIVLSFRTSWHNSRLLIFICFTTVLKCLTRFIIRRHSSYGLIKSLKLGKILSEIINIALILIINEIFVIQPFIILRILNERFINFMINNKIKATSPKWSQLPHNIIFSNSSYIVSLTVECSLIENLNSLFE
jgi:hypothetical protein